MVFSKRLGPEKSLELNLGPYDGNYSSFPLLLIQ